MHKFELGQEVRDRVTGYQGVVMVRAEYFTGCIHYGVLSREPDKEGNERPWNWLDQSRWESVPDVERIMPPEIRTSGPYAAGPQY